MLHRAPDDLVKTAAFLDFRGALLYSLSIDGLLPGTWYILKSGCLFLDKTHARGAQICNPYVPGTIRFGGSERRVLVYQAVGRWAVRER